MIWFLPYVQPSQKRMLGREVMEVFWKIYNMHNKDITVHYTIQSNNFINRQTDTRCVLNPVGKGVGKYLLILYIQINMTRTTSKVA